MRDQNASQFPVCAVLPKLSKALLKSNKALLTAPTGAGKTSLVPLHLLKEDWAKHKKIILLQPRRLAVQNAAAHMAHLSKQPLGQLIGYKIRFEEVLTEKTRILIMTEGVFAKILIKNPDLQDIGAVIFDEFHERTKEADFSLALLLDIQEALRKDLRIVLMSATLNSNDLLQKFARNGFSDIPVIESKGRSFPISLRYRPPKPNQSLEEHMAKEIVTLLQEEKGNILAFLPGRKEIQKVQSLLQSKLQNYTHEKHLITCLYSGLSKEEQNKALLPTKNLTRKIILATSIAETSLTLDNVHIVIDSGLTRRAVFDTKNFMTSLKTQKASYASIEQRSGRAGRQAPGIAVRLWSKPQNASFPPYDTPKIEREDIRDILLDSLEFGVQDLTKLAFLDPPSDRAIKKAKAQLIAQNLLTQKGERTEHAHKIKNLPFPFALSLMITKANEKRNAYEAVLLALILSERSLQIDSDLDICLQNLLSFKNTIHLKNNKWHKIARRIADSFKQSSLSINTSGLEHKKNISAAELLLEIFPYSLAKNRGNNGQFLLASGSGVFIDPHTNLAQEKYLLVLNSSGESKNSRILTAAKCSEELIFALLKERLQIEIEGKFCPKTKNFSVIGHYKIGVLSLKKTEPKIKNLSEKEQQNIFKSLLKTYGLSFLPWGEKSKTFYQRVQWICLYFNEGGLNFSDDTLIEDVDLWLWPFLLSLQNLKSLTDETLYQALYQRLNPFMQKKIDEIAPAYYAIEGRKYKIIYDLEHKTPILRLKVQELYGQNRHPSIHNNTLKLRLELLSPADRPIQITENLPLFWQGSWQEVRKEMQSRYPKHFWPKNPIIVNNLLLNSKKSVKIKKTQ